VWVVSPSELPWLKFGWCATIYCLLLQARGGAVSVLVEIRLSGTRRHGVSPLATLRSIRSQMVTIKFWTINVCNSLSWSILKRRLKPVSASMKLSLIRWC
jgi:hypothetical protein